MNAVTTAEYVVLDEINLTVFTEKLNRYAKEGFKLTNFETGLWEKDNQSWYTAVMVRELAAPTTVQAATLHKRITILEERLAKLERQQNFMLETSENRFEDIEAKIDWLK